jgi:hypothetical protein
MLISRKSRCSFHPLGEAASVARRRFQQILPADMATGALASSLEVDACSVDHCATGQLVADPEAR